MPNKGIKLERSAAIFRCTSVPNSLRIVSRPGVAGSFDGNGNTTWTLFFHFSNGLKFWILGEW